MKQEYVAVFITIGSFIVMVAGILIQLGRILEQIKTVKESVAEMKQVADQRFKDVEASNRECKRDHGESLVSLKNDRNERLDRLERKLDEVRDEIKADSDRFKAFVEGSVSHQNNKLTQMQEQLLALNYRLQELDLKKVSAPRIQAVQPPPVSMMRDSAPEYVPNPTTAGRRDPRREG